MPNTNGIWLLPSWRENTINSITNQVTYDSESGVRTTTPLNLNGNWRAMGSFSLNTLSRIVVGDSVHIHICNTETRTGIAL